MTPNPQSTNSRRGAQFTKGFLAFDQCSCCLEFKVPHFELFIAQSSAKWHPLSASNLV